MYCSRSPAFSGVGSSKGMSLSLSGLVCSANIRSYVYTTRVMSAGNARKGQESWSQQKLQQWLRESMEYGQSGTASTFSKQLVHHSRKFSKGEHTQTSPCLCNADFDDYHVQKKLLVKELTRTHDFLDDMLGHCVPFDG